MNRELWGYGPGKKEKMKTQLARALYRLASHHGHEWVSHVSIDAVAFDWDSSVAMATDSMDQAERDRTVSMPRGLYPSLSHTTLTGRLSWSAEMGDRLVLRVSRPGVIDGRTVVLAELIWDTDEMPVWSLTIDATPISGACLRHLVCIHDAIYAAIGNPLTEEEAIQSAISRVEMHAENSWSADEFRCGSAIGLLTSTSQL